MAVYKQPKSKYWWYKFVWNGEPVRESTKQTNKRVAEQMQAAHRTALAKGEVGIREKKRASTLGQFMEWDFMPFVERHFTDKPSTVAYYRSGVKHLSNYADLANTPVDSIGVAQISGFVEVDRNAGYKVSTTNRHLQILRRILRLAGEWGKSERAAPRISLLPGENRRERVVTPAEEAKYLDAAGAIGEGLIEAYNRALEGMSAKQRGQIAIKPDDPYLLHDVAVVLLDCGLRPEECHRLRWEHVRDGALNVPFGKTANARRRIPLPQLAASILEMRRAAWEGDWVFPAPTKSGHIEQSTLRKRHAQACKLAELDAIPLYTFRHTCLTSWAAVMDPYTLAYLAGHSDFATTRRYVHPQTDTVLAAMEKAQAARSGHTSSGHTDEMELAEASRKATLIV
jgi:integrase